MKTLQTLLNGQSRLPDYYPLPRPRMAGVNVVTPVFGSHPEKLTRKELLKRRKAVTERIAEYSKKYWAEYWAKKNK